MKRKSIIQTANECYICHSQRDLETHHCIHGTSGRRKADADGLTVQLCRSCHRALHDKGTHDKTLMRIAEAAWIFHNHADVEAFRERYGKSWI